MTETLMDGRELAVELCVLPKNLSFAVPAGFNAPGLPEHKVETQTYQSKKMTVAEFCELTGADVPEELDADLLIDLGEIASAVMKPTLYSVDDLSRELSIDVDELEQRIDLLGLEADGEQGGEPAYHLTNVVPWVLWRLYTVNKLSEVMNVDRRTVTKKLQGAEPVATKSLGDREARYYWLHQAVLFAS